MSNKMFWCFVGQDGLEHIEVRLYYLLDKLSEVKTRILNYEEITD